MLLRTLVFYLVLVAAYFTIGKAGVLHYHFGKTEWDYDTFLKAEHYAYGDTIKPNHVVIVGSSLTCQVKPPFSYPFSNLSISGRTSLDGIELIKRKGVMPATVLIETNVFDRGRDSSIDYKLYTPGIGWLKSKLFFLRMEYKMHNLIPLKIPVAEKILGWVATHSGLYSETKNKAAKTGEVNNSELFKQLVRDKMARIAELEVDSNDLEVRYKNLADEVQFLKQRGVNVVLVEVPMSYKIEQSTKWQYMKVMLERFRQEMNVPYWKVPNPERYQHTFVIGDGIHLQTEERNLYEKFLADSVSALMH